MAVVLAWVGAYCIAGLGLVDVAERRAGAVTIPAWGDPCSASSCAALTCCGSMMAGGASFASLWLKSV